MSNSGVYQYKNSIYSGTSQRIEKMFISQNGVKYEDKNFKIVVNDNCLKRIDCQKCTWRRVANKRNNVEKLFFHLDVEQFLTNECLAILNEAKKMIGIFYCFMIHSIY
ncbi:hypothetical protein D3I36_11740 [Enterococcus faecalis]|uniref:hypothetical protein n=1 Tax=Enterococcus faecalis TaxID=1351 RepID=UPI0001B259E7|nr:predicted protein [Enterococcus faecalis ATCC 4200]EGO8971435.1 hypothetical protein [Enterococcus faecalis]